MKIVNTSSVDELNHMSRGVDDARVRLKIVEIVSQKVTK